MEAKKTFRSNLENKRLLFLEVGALITLALVLVAFEWTSSKLPEVILKPVTDNTLVTELITPPTKPSVPPIPMPLPPTITITIVPDDQLVPNDYIPIDRINPEDYFITIQNLFGKEEPPVDDITFTNPQEWPTFMGKDIEEFRRWVGHTLRMPSDLVGTDLEGTVQVVFVVGKDGYIRDIKVYRSMTPSIEAEIVRVLNLSPRWQPGKQLGLEVSVQYAMPVKFVLN